MDNTHFIYVASLVLLALVTWAIIFWRKRQYDFQEVAAGLVDAELPNDSESVRRSKTKFVFFLALATFGLDAILGFPKIFSPSIRGFYFCVILFSGAFLVIGFFKSKKKT